jgi:hypothetical protein
MTVEEMKCKWCGAYLWDYGDVGPRHGKDGRSVNACELIQLRKLRDELIAVARKLGSGMPILSDAVVQRANELASR